MRKYICLRASISENVSLLKPSPDETHSLRCSAFFELKLCIGYATISAQLVALHVAKHVQSEREAFTAETINPS